VLESLWPSSQAMAEIGPLLVRRHAAKPRKAKPVSSIAHVPGSGAPLATGSAANWSPCWLISISAPGLRLKVIVSVRPNVPSTSKSPLLLL
jgi:hypothetical protein